MSGQLPYRGHKTRWNKPHRGRGSGRGRGSVSIGRGDITDPPNHGTERKIHLQSDKGNRRGSRGGTRTKTRAPSSGRKENRYESHHTSDQNCASGSNDADQRGGWRPRGKQGGSSRGRDSRGRRGHNTDANGYVKLDYESLSSMLEKEPDELVISLTSEKSLPAFESLLGKHDLPDKDVVMIFRVFARACDSETTQVLLIMLLNKLIGSAYLSSALTRYINCLSYASKDKEQDLENSLKSMIKLFTELLRKLPTSFPDLPLPNLLLAVTSLVEKGQILDTEIKSSVDNLVALKDEMAEKVKKEVEEKANKPHRRHIDRAALLDNEDPPENYRSLSIVPRQSDIHPNEPVFFRRNKVQGSYDTPEHYLDVQFRLLREDFIRPLREGIAALSERSGTFERKPQQDIRVYKGVRILDPVYTSKGVSYEISFDASKMRHVNWENSKRLIYGSLLCLSKDGFKSFILATVEERKAFDLRRGNLKVKLKNLFDDLGKESDVYQMVETTAYYEAYCHVLEGLKGISPKQFPFERYIVKSEPDVQAPFYLRNTTVREAVTYDLHCIIKDEYQNSSKGRAVKVLDLDSWPSAEDLELDTSQLKAVQLALTKEFSIIQGPPGTGKTYIGLKVVKVLLNNKEHWHKAKKALDDEDNFRSSTRPILVVCYTNHALDQFLEGIHEFHPEGIVRVGGRSQSEKMQACSLRTIKEEIRKFHKVKKRERVNGYFSAFDDDDDDDDDVPNIAEQFRDVYHEQKWIRSELYEAHQEMDLVSSSLENVNKEIRRLSKYVISEKNLRNAGHMSVQHYESLIGRFKEVNKMGIKVKPDVLHYWLELLANQFDNFELGSFIKPVAVYPLTQASNSSLHLATRYVEPALQGPDQSNDGSCMLKSVSYIMIPNTVNSPLDTRYSMTILLYFYPMSQAGGPIVSYVNDAGNIGIQISQAGCLNDKGVLSVTFNSRNGEIYPPLVTDGVLELNEWNYIGASYDYNSGVLCVWHDGRMVQAQTFPRMELLSYLPVYVGATNRDNCFHLRNIHSLGKVSSLQIFPQAIGQEQIMAMAGVRTEDFEPRISVEENSQIALETRDDYNEKEEEEEQNGKSDVLLEANALEDLRKLDEDEVVTFGSKEENDQQGTEAAYPLVDNNLGEWQFQNSKRKMAKTIKREISKKDVMTDEEVKQVTDVWTLSKCDRWRLYGYWIEKLREAFKRRARSYHRDFELCAERFKALQSQQDLTILRRATIIGMTTTGAAKYRSLLQSVRPRITIVEEAAEVLESHIVTSLNPGCQHLILIGDHEQLRPSPNVYELAKDYSLDVSLFERMVGNGMDYQTLHKQHRMRPEIARMMKPIYGDDLQNHESVLNFENIKGVKNNIFFVDHDQLEEFVEEGISRSNIHEAKYLAALCRYFILQGYDQTKITILTMYVGQLLKLKRETSDEIFKGVRICAVDNFQGEENDIILLSLVRSNEEGNIGFLRISNRVCVALSRARKGFYCIGNLELMCRKEKLWTKIVEDMRESENVGQYLTLMCQNHPKTVIHASQANDFLKAPQGGCMLPCHARLDCGHACRLKCHPTDPEHIEYECNEPCTKECDLGHKCKKRCYKECGPCPVPMEKIMPQCNHVQELPCHLYQSKTKCAFPCEAILNCGHRCTGSCHECFKGRLHISCEQKCERTLVCGHKCLDICSRKCPPCSRECENECAHQKCSNNCGEPCEPCKEMCTWKCEHYECTSLCGELCNRPRCHVPCTKTLLCEHPCTGLCGEPCPKKCQVCSSEDEIIVIELENEESPEERFVELQPCGDVIEVDEMDAWIDDCRNGVTTCIQLKSCPKCMKPIRSCPRYDNIIKSDLQDVEKVKTKFSHPDYDIQEEASRLKSQIQFFGQFTMSSMDIQANLEGKDLSVEILEKCRTQINLLNILSRMLQEISTFKKYVRNRFDLVSLEEEVMALEDRERKKGMTMGYKMMYQYSDQEKEEIRNEILRLQLIVYYRILNMLIQEEREMPINDTVADDLNLIGQTIDSGDRIDEKKLDSHMKTLDRINNYYEVATQFDVDRRIKKEDTIGITNSFGFTQGNWFKCPEGHVYFKNDVCPECFSDW